MNVTHLPKYLQFSTSIKLKKILNSRRDNLTSRKTPNSCMKLKNTPYFGSSIISTVIKSCYI